MNDASIRNYSLSLPPSLPLPLPLSLLSPSLSLFFSLPLIRTQDLNQLFSAVLEHIRQCQVILIDQELTNWKQSQRLFSWEDDRGKVELSNIQQW